MTLSGQPSVSSRRSERCNQEASTKGRSERCNQETSTKGRSERCNQETSTKGFQVRLRDFEQLFCQRTEQQAMVVGMYSEKGDKKNIMAGGTNQTFY